MAYSESLPKIAQVVPELFNFLNLAVTSHRCKAYRENMRPLCAFAYFSSFARICGVVFC